MQRNIPLATPIPPKLNVPDPKISQLPAGNVIEATDMEVPFGKVTELPVPGEGCSPALPAEGELPDANPVRLVA